MNLSCKEAPTESHLFHMVFASPSMENSPVYDTFVWKNDEWDAYISKLTLIKCCVLGGGGTNQVADYTFPLSIHLLCGKCLFLLMVRLNELNAFLLAARSWGKLNHGITFSLKKKNNNNNNKHITGVCPRWTKHWVNQWDIKDDNWASHFESHNKASLVVSSHHGRV